MNAIVQTKRILPEERAKIWNQVTRKTVAIGMITDESIYSITSKITTTPKRTAEALDAFGLLEQLSLWQGSLNSYIFYMFRDRVG